jgi:hypothetical protein
MLQGQHRLAFESPFLKRRVAKWNCLFRNGDSRSEIAYFGRFPQNGVA